MNGLVKFLKRHHQQLISCKLFLMPQTIIGINLLYFLIFIFGLIIGSFLNCVIYRLETKENFLKGRSFCVHCKHLLSWQDLIPIFSFLFLKGKCRYCNQKISLQYPLVEIITGLLFLLIFNHFLISFDFYNLFFYLIISCFLIIIFVFDLKHYIIPDSVIFSIIFITFLYQLFKTGLDLKILLNPFFSGFFAGLFFLIIILISQGKWMGMGDFKLVIFMGLFLGYPKILFALFSSFLIGAIIGTILIILGKKTMKSEIPFGPFLITGTFLALFFGEKIINWYLNFII